MIHRALLYAVLALLPLCACKPLPEVEGASTHIEAGDYAAAVKRIEQGLSRRPGDDGLYRMLIHSRMAMDQPGAAVAAYRRHEQAVGRDREMSAFLGLTLLRWALTHRDTEVRLAGIQGVRSSDAAPLLRDMLRRLNDPNEFVRTWAAVALSRLPQGAEVLDEQLRSSSARARALAVQWVARIAGDRAVAVAGGAAKDGSAEVRVAAAGALALTGPGGVEPLLKLLGDKEREVRVAAARALGELKQGSARKALAKALADDYLAARLAAAEALGKLGDARSKPALRKLASSEDLITALGAGKALARLGEVQPALDAIARAMELGDGPARVAACNAAVTLEDRVAGQLTARGLKDADPAVKMAAARAARAHGDVTAAVRAARAVLAASCSKKAAGESDGPRCLSAAELLAQEKVREGSRELKRLATAATEPALRLQALNANLRLAPEHDLAVTAVGDKDPRVSVAAAAWLYKKYK